MKNMKDLSIKIPFMYTFDYCLNLDRIKKDIVVNSINVYGVDNDNNVRDGKVPYIITNDGVLLPQSKEYTKFVMETYRYEEWEIINKV